MGSTQESVPIQDIKNDVVILKDGSMAVVLQTSAVNFGLLSENEQLAIIYAFAGMLNSLSFIIQIVIRSKRLDITKYIDQLDAAQQKQTNPLLIQMIERYRNFIKSTIQENEVLDKKFYMVVPLSYLEIGISRDFDTRFKKAITLLMPRRDQIIRQLARIGLKATQLDTEQLVKLFYDIYNESDQQPLQQSIVAQPEATQAQPATTITEQVPIVEQKPEVTPPPAPVQAPPAVNQSAVNQPQVMQQPTSNIVSQITDSSPAQAVKSAPLNNPRNKPYIVEELPD